MPKVGRTQRILLIVLLTIPELVALVPLAWHYLHPARPVRDPKPSAVTTQASVEHPGQ